MSSYEKLFTPITIGQLTLPNRIVMGSMHTGLEELDDLERMTTYFAERARGGCSLMVTGGVSPNQAGRLFENAVVFDKRQASLHQKVTQSVHQAGGHILLQILHAGRYGAHSDIVAPSPIRSPITRFTPRQMAADEISETIDQFVEAAVLSKEAGYDGVEIMGSEGYLITEFIAERTNQRQDEWGGSFANRCRFASEIVEKTRNAVGPDFIIMFRLSILDLVEGGSNEAEVVTLAQQLESAGASVLNTGIGWHEATIPTIAQAVPRAAFAEYCRNVIDHISIPLIASNRINTPEVAEQVLLSGVADMVSMARPFLADPKFVSKAQAGRGDEINTCIACNQACLDHIFEGKISSCLVNPKACHENELLQPPPSTKAAPRKFAVVGAGPAGLQCACDLAERGHAVTLYESSNQIGGLFNLAKAVPGKNEFSETLRYFTRRLEITGVVVRLGEKIESSDLLEQKFDEVILATGVIPRQVELEGSDHDKVTGYTEVLSAQNKPGKEVVIIGGGGIAFDVALYLLEKNSAAMRDVGAFKAAWGIGQEESRANPEYDITMLQRSTGRMGKGLGKTTGWIHRAILRKNNVRQISGVTYMKIDDDGVHISIDGEVQILPADSVIICAGQERQQDLKLPLEQAGVRVHVIGGAKQATGIDAKRAIREAAELALKL